MAFRHFEEAAHDHRTVQHGADLRRGAGLSAALARALAAEGIKVALAARSTADLADLAKETGSQLFICDASKRGDVEKLFADLDAGFGPPEIVVYNPSYRTRGAFIELDPAEVEKALIVTAFGGFLVGQQAAKRMLPKTPRRHPVHRRLRQRERLCAVGAVRDGQVRSAGLGAKHVA